MVNVWDVIFLITASSISFFPSFVVNSLIVFYDLWGVKISPGGRSLFVCLARWTGIFAFLAYCAYLFNSKQ